MMEICKSIRKDTDPEVHVGSIEKLEKMLSSKTEDDCKIFKLRDMHQLKGSIYLLLGEYQVAAREFEKTLELFNAEKMKEKEKHFIDDSEEFEDEWS